MLYASLHINMTSPTDSLQHGLHERQEGAASSEKPRVVGRPLCYTSSGAMSSLDLMDIEQFTNKEEGEDYKNEEMPAVPVKNSMYSSVSIKGEGNTIIYPAAPDHKDSPLSKNQQTLAASAVVLKGSLAIGVVRTRPVQIKINARTSIKGNRNAICQGISKIVRHGAQQNTGPFVDAREEGRRKKKESKLGMRLRSTACRLLAFLDRNL